jgi:plastocyanin
MVKKSAVVIASVVTAGAIAAMYFLSGNMGVEGSGNGQEPAASIPENSTVVKIVANAGSSSFGPNPVEVKAGETVTWINDDAGTHTVTSEDGAFESELMGKGESFSFAFDEAGEYQYFCAPHPSMVGTVTVTQG